MFTPEKTGYYFVDVENGSVSSVQKLETQESAQALDAWNRNFFGCRRYAVF